MSAFIAKRCASCGNILGAQQLPLTRVQADVLKFICDHIVARSCAPTYGEMSTHFGWKSLASVKEHVSRLEQKGYIRVRYNAVRGITVLVQYDDVGAIPMEVINA